MNYLGIWTIAPMENCPQLGLGLGIRVAGNFPLVQLSWNQITCTKFLYILYIMIMETHQRNYYTLNLTHRKVWLCFIKLTADKFLTHLCLDKCKQGTMKSLEIRIASFCELFQNRFYFKDVKRELSSWSVRKFWNFWFHCIINITIIIIKPLLLFV